MEIACIYLYSPAFSHLQYLTHRHGMDLSEQVLKSGKCSKISIFTTSTTSKELADFLKDDYNFELCMRKLTLKEQLKVRNSKHNQQKELVSRLFSMAILNHAIHCQRLKLCPDEKYNQWAELLYEYNQYGKPRLQDQSKLNFEFNSSGSNDIISIAIKYDSHSPIGIDLSHESQDLISSTHFMDQFQGIFAPQEVEQLDRIIDIGQKYLSFNHFWTLKEAFTKFVGCGLNIDLSSFWFRLPHEKLKFKNAIGGSQSQLVSRYYVDWLSGIEVDYLRICEPFKSEIGNDKVYCYSGVLRRSGNLPVIISCISKDDKMAENITCLHINMKLLLDRIVG